VGRVVAAPEAGADPLLADELHRGLDQVLKQPQLLAVQGVNRRLGRGAVIADVAQELADVGPVLLLDVRVIVLLVSARTKSDC